MRTLYLHIGHSKTGSSFLQASFANSLAAMAEHGIEYPGAPSEAATGWKISSGNGQPLLNTPPEEFEITGDKVFFSAERLFRAFAVEEGWPARLAAFCKVHDIGAVEVLMFLRDPIPHAESSYQQMVKRGGSVDTVETTFTNYTQPEMVRDALTRDYGPVKVNWHLFSYDRNKTGLLPITEAFLGLPEGTLVRGGDKAVNRSMTAGELTILRGLNAHDPAAASLLADALCNEVPEIASETVYPSTEAQQAMIDRLSGAIAEVDAMLAPSERYSVDLRPPADEAEAFTFSLRQVEVMTATLGARVQDVTIQMQIERARRQINMAQVLFDKGRLDEADTLLARAGAGLKGLDGYGDVDGLKRIVDKLVKASATRAAAAAKAAEAAKAEAAQAEAASAAEASGDAAAGTATAEGQAQK